MIYNRCNCRVRVCIYLFVVFVRARVRDRCDILDVIKSLEHIDYTCRKKTTQKSCVCTFVCF